MNREHFPMNAAELMDNVVVILKKSFWMQIAYAGIVYMLAFVGVFVVLMLFAAVFMVSVATAGYPGSYAMIIVAGLAILPLFMIWQAFSSAGHILLSRQAFYGFKVSISHMGIFKVLFRVISSVIAQIILFIPFVIVSIGAVIFMGMLFENMGTVMGQLPVIIFILAIFSLLLFGFLIYSNIFALSIAVAAFERRYFFDTITRSFQLIKSDFWRVLGVRSIWYIIVLGFSFSAQGVFSLLTVGWGFLAGSVPSGLLILVGVFISIFAGFVGPIIVSLVVAPLDGIMQSLIYFNQRMKTEGFDLELRIEKL
ncbi:MAG: hypothetical protein FWF79_00460 [Defluviitaleaceae bacterium]|nr:hypothetical protein [Defluviitaleaceae bacterium]